MNKVVRNFVIPLFDSVYKLCSQMPFLLGVNGGLLVPNDSKVMIKRIVVSTVVSSGRRRQILEEQR